MSREASSRMIHILTDALTRKLTSQEYVDAVELLSRIRAEGERGIRDMLIYDAEEWGRQQAQDDAA